MKFQAPRGTRDFYPQDTAWRQYLMDAWRRVSVRNGFEAVDGPIFEPLDLYKVKSGEGIVNEVFHVRHPLGETEYALRPEFTPTLARMVAERANSLPKPIKWFCIPNLCRAERPQRGRLREFLQWNCDMIGLDDALADAECIFTMIDLLRELGLGPQHARVKISHRQTVRHILGKLGVGDEKMLAAFELLDRRDKLESEEFTRLASGLGLDEQRVQRFEQICRMKYACGSLDKMRSHMGIDQDLADLEALDRQLRGFGIEEWCEYDLGIVRGLAYYTGTVFEVHEASGAMRAMAGGGRYDQLVELFGGPSLPAVGFGMGDVVLTDVLSDKRLLPDDVAPRPDVFVIGATDLGGRHLLPVTADLRRRGLHVRFTYRSTRNVGKLLKEASAARARYALILDDQADAGRAAIKDLVTGEQQELPLADLAARLGR
jgi:histidyl-tRNA synthetase